MTWRPVIADPDERARLVAIVREIVIALDAWHTESRSLADLLDYAMLRSYLALDDTVPDPDDAASVALAGALDAFSLGKHGPALYGGAAALGFAIAHLAGGESADLACAEIDRALTQRLATPHYDLINGLVGFGVYALERGDGARELARAVLDQLAARAIARGPGIAWYTEAELLPPREAVLEPAGYWNLGLSHGNAGVIAWLARYVVAFPDDTRAKTLLDGAIAYMHSLDDGHALPPQWGRYPAWEPRDRGAREIGPDTGPTGRLAWCYGDLGVALALLAAAEATGDPAWRARALAVARPCAGREPAAASVFDSGVCHGSAGVAHLFGRLYAATDEEVFAASARRWLAQTLGARTELPIAGFPQRLEGEWRADASLLSGAVGVALVLHAATSQIEPSWDRKLLLDRVASIVQVH